MPRPADAPVRPKNAAQAKARAKARKAKAPKVVRPPLRERLLVKLSSIDLDPRSFVTRVPFVVLVIGALGVGLGVTLWLSTDAAERSYQLGHARQVNQALLQQKEGLERDVLEAQAAPALAEAARNLGMIPSRDTAHLVQDPSGNWIVVGTPKPAEGVPPPPLNSPLPEPTPPAPARRRPRRASSTRARWPCTCRRTVAPPSAEVPVPNADGTRARRRRTARRTRGRGTRARSAPAPAPAPAAAPADVPVAPLRRWHPATSGRLHGASRCRARRPAPKRWCPRPRPGRPREPSPIGDSPKSPPAAKAVAAQPHSARDAAYPQPVGRGRSAQRLVRVPAPGRQRRDRAGAASSRPASCSCLQVPRAAGLRAEAAGQLKVTDVEKAVRGSIVDRNDDKLAFTIEARALTFQPAKIQKQLVEAKAKKPDAPDPVKRLREIAKGVSGLLNNKPDADTLLKKLSSKDSFVYLARAVDPAISDAIIAKYPEVGAERQDIRQYPGGSLAANIVGGIDWDGHGLLGLEDSLDAKLAGTDGSVTYDRGSDGVVIPGSYRNRHDAVDGSTIQLTIDDDIQFYVQQQVQQAKNLSGAKNVSAVVLDAKTGEVLAMSNDNTFDPSQDIGRQEDRELGNLVGVLTVRAGLGEQDHHRVVGDRVRPDEPRRGAAGARLDRHGRRHRARRVGPRRDAVHHHRRLR